MISKNFVAFSELFSICFATLPTNYFCRIEKFPNPTDIIEYLRHAAVKRIGLGYGLSPSGGEADILRPIREDGFRQSPTETMYEVSVQN